MTDYLADDRTSRQLRAALADGLRARGTISAPEWHRIFATVPRHAFVPHVFLPAPTNDGSYQPLDGTDPARRAEWLRHVYSDEICVTQLDGSDRAWRTALAEGTVTASRMTCTSSQPTLMASMLEELGVSDGDRVLEIGTGTGYNAALLCERLGAEAVTTLDIDAGLVERARFVLGRLGYAPTVAIADGFEGCPTNAPYTHVIATASFPAIPTAWVEQTTEGGTILVNVHRPLGGGLLARLAVGAGVASGRFSQRTAGFMPTRTHQSPSALRLYRQVTEEDEEAATPETTDIDLSSVLRHPDSRSFLALVSDIEDLGVSFPNHPNEHWLLTPDGSWAFSVPTDGGRTVRQGGRRRLFDEAVALYREWRRLGSPPRSAFGLTVTGSEQFVWHASPEGDQRWPLVP